MCFPLKEWKIPATCFPSRAGVCPWLDQSGPPTSADLRRRQVLVAGTDDSRDGRSWDWWVVLSERQEISSVT